MKKILISLVCLVLLAATFVPAATAQERQRSRFGRKARTAAIIGGGTAVGALIGGGKGAAIGGGASTVYALNRGAARRHFKGRTRTIGTVAGGTVAGAGLGSAVGGGKGAAIGALAGGAGSAYYRHRQIRRSRRY